MTSVVHQRREQAHAPLAAEPFYVRDWFINPKTPKPFDLFDGNDNSYHNWASRVKDHLMSTDLNWGRLLEVVETQPQPHTNARLARMTGLDDAPLDLHKITQILWAFLGSHVLKTSVDERRLQLAGGEDNNGLG